MMVIIYFIFFVNCMLDVLKAVKFIINFVFLGDPAGTCLPEHHSIAGMLYWEMCTFSNEKATRKIHVCPFGIL